MVHAGALGDFILALPAVLSLRKSMPDHSFIGIGRPEYLDIASYLGALDLTWDMEAHWLLPFFSARKIPAELAEISGAVLWLSKAHRIKRILEKGGANPVIILPTVPVKPVHAARFYLQEIGKFYPVHTPAEMSELFPRIPLDEKYIFIHPGSGSTRKNYPLQLFKELGLMLSQKSPYKIGYILGPAEIENGMREQLANHWVLNPANISQLINWLKNTALFIGNDSGVSHLAGLLGIFSIALYKSTDPDIWGIMGRKAFNVYEANKTNIPDRIFAILKSRKFIS